MGTALQRSQSQRCTVITPSQVQCLHQTTNSNGDCGRHSTPDSSTYLPEISGDIIDANLSAYDELFEDADTHANPRIAPIAARRAHGMPDFSSHTEDIKWKRAKAGEYDAEIDRGGYQSSVTILKRTSRYNSGSVWKVSGRTGHEQLFDFHHGGFDTLEEAKTAVDKRFDHRHHCNAATSSLSDTIYGIRKRIDHGGVTRDIVKRLRDGAEQALISLSKVEADSAWRAAVLAAHPEDSLHWRYAVERLQDTIIVARHMADSYESICQAMDDANSLVDDVPAYNPHESRQRCPNC